MSLLEEFYSAYDMLYELDVQKLVSIDYSEAVKWFDDNHGTDEVTPYLLDLIKKRGDLISSDREAGAFTIAYNKVTQGVKV